MVRSAGIRERFELGKRALKELVKGASSIAGISPVNYFCMKYTQCLVSHDNGAVPVHGPRC